MVKTTATETGKSYPHRALVKPGERQLPFSRESREKFSGAFKGM